MKPPLGRPANRPSPKRKSGNPSRHPFRVALYARVSTTGQQTLPMQLKALREFVRQRGWQVELELKEVRSGSLARPKREEVLRAARRREIDAIAVWRLDRWGRSLADLAATFVELNELGVAFVSLTEALDLTTSSGRAMAGMLAVFAEFEREILRERIVAGMQAAKARGQILGMPRKLNDEQAAELRRLWAEGGISKNELGRRFDITRSSVRFYLQDGIHHYEKAGAANG